MKIDTFKQIVLASRPDGQPTVDNFRLEQATLPDTPPNELLVRVLYLSLDPYMRGRMSAQVVRDPVAIDEDGRWHRGQVVDSRHPDFATGDYVLAYAGWHSHAVVDGNQLRKLDPDAAPLSTRVGVLGMPGFTAYAGLMMIGKPKPGDTVVVAAASGPVGSTRRAACANSRGRRAVGIAGGSEKCALRVGRTRFRRRDRPSAPEHGRTTGAACPDGIDVYFENVGGKMMASGAASAQPLARVPVCGLIAQYSGDQENANGQLAATMRQILTKSLLVRGFINYEFADEHYPEFLRIVSNGIGEGRIRCKEDIVDGLEKAPEAFLGMLEGRNFGKVVVRVADPAKFD